jgi:serine/threonine-protein kinase HipA
MTKILNVYFQEKIIGKLVQDNNGDVSFTYSKEWLEDSHAIAISCSLPLQEERFGRKECRAFFEGLLPEQDQRKTIAKNLGISDKNDFSMLEKIGGECAGALSFLPSGKKLNSEDNTYRQLTDVELARILKELPTKPLLAGESGVRLSLAGVQDKLAVYVEDEEIFIPLNSAPSTHILKPAYGANNGVIFNEYFCLKLARKIGLSVAEVEIKKIEDIDYLLIKRYDRIMSIQGNQIQRVHQEDFCQALGIPSTKKYQNEEGPSLKQCFDLVRDKSSKPVIDLEKMLNSVIFNYFIGNCDAHGKNFSLLYLNKLQLAPLYNLVCTLYYEDIEKKMAMKLGGECEINKIKPKNFDKFAEEAGLSKSEVRKRVLKLSDEIIAALPTIKAQCQTQKSIADLIGKRCNDFSRFVKSRASDRE